MDTEKIIDALQYNDGSFPREALELAIENKELLVPRLLQEVEYAIENIDIINTDEAYMLHIYSLYLLAQFREKKAYPLIAAFFSLPGDMAQHVTGDVITEDLGRILASTFDGNIDLLKEIIENRKINEFTRSAALKALCILWGQEALTRKQVVEYFQFLMSVKFAGETSELWSALVAQCINLSPNELEEHVEDAFNRNLVEEFYVSRDDFRGALGLSDEEALRKYACNRRSLLIDDTVTEMESWACFKSGKKKIANLVQQKSNSGNNKIGRNEPCYCGSGKKYKKCCLSAA